MSTKRSILILALSVFALSGGCGSFYDTVGVPRSGYQSDGTYVVTSEEEGLACRQIAGRVSYLNGQIKKFPVAAEAEEKKLPSHWSQR